MPALPASVLALLFFFAASLPAQQVHFVVEGGAGAQDGSTWADASGDLTAMLAVAAPGDQIWLAEGRYTPAGPGGPPSATFTLVPGVSLYGGFAGTESSPAQRVPGAHPTILSGDLDGDDGLSPPNKDDNVDHVLTAGPAVGASAVLDGLAVSGGYATSSSGSGAYGAGLLCNGASPTLVGCTLSDNLSTLGGAVVALGGAPSFTDCSFTANRAWSGRGGALYMTSACDVSIEGCTFSDNSSYGGGGVGDGGALFVEGGAQCAISDSTFLRNVANAFQPNFATGGAISNLSDGLSLTRCVFRDNDGRVGGALWNGGDITVAGCVFAANSAEVGGGVMNFFAAPTYVSCTFVANSAPDGGGMTNGFGALVDIHDCILWGNLSPGQPTARAQLHNMDNGDATLRSTCLQGLLETIPGEDPPDPANYPGCLDADPLLADAPDDLHLLPGSPCIDAGDNGALPAGLDTDLDGGPRRQDDPATPDTGAGGPPIVDMGADELGDDPWTALGGGTPGINGVPVLTGSGPLTAGSTLTLDLQQGPSGALALLWLSTASSPFAALGGTVHAFPYLDQVLLATDGAGAINGGIVFPPGVPSGSTLYFQWLLQDASVIYGITLSNGVRGTTP